MYKVSMSVPLVLISDIIVVTHPHLWLKTLGIKTYQDILARACWSVCVCVCVCMLVCVHVSVSVYSCEWMYASRCVCMYVHVCLVHVRAIVYSTPLCSVSWQDQDLDEPAAKTSSVMSCNVIFVFEISMPGVFPAIPMCTCVCQAQVCVCGWLCLGGWHFYAS